MSVGVTRGERVGPDAIRAFQHSISGWPLPPSSASVTLDYPGKVPSAEILAPYPSSLVSVHAKTFKELSHLEPNAFMLADNFIGLHAVRKAGLRPTLIYLDPPYATGFDFHSRDLEHAYGDQFAPAAYLEFMRRRLILMREILADDGSLYLHIGHQMVAQLKILLDEIFGVDNFRNLIIRKKCSSKNFTKNQYSNLHDYILFYTKSSRYKWNQPGITPEQDWIDKEYPKHDQLGRYKLVPVHAPGSRRGETGGPWRDMLPPNGKHWQYVPSKLEEMNNQGLIHWSKNGNPRRKVYLTPDKQVTMTDYWDQFRDAHHQSIPITGYPTEKNLDLLKLIVSASSDPGDLVIDPFCGSGTTLDAAESLGRRWLGIDDSLQSARTTVKRMRYGMKPMGDFVKKAEADDLFECRPAPASRRDVNFKLVADAGVATLCKKELVEVAGI